jgi:hypothetical protein
VRGDLVMNINALRDWKPQLPLFSAAGDTWPRMNHDAT